MSSQRQSGGSASHVRNSRATGLLHLPTSYHLCWPSAQLSAVPCRKSFLHSSSSPLLLHYKMPPRQNISGGNSCTGGLHRVKVLALPHAVQHPEWTKIVPPHARQSHFERSRRRNFLTPGTSNIQQGFPPGLIWYLCCGTACPGASCRPMGILCIESRISSPAFLISRHCFILHL